MIPAPYVVTSFVDGESLPRPILRTFDGEDGHDGEAFAEQLGDIAARLHSAEVPDGLFEARTDELEAWRSQFDEYGVVSPAFELAFAHLGDTPPPSSEPAFVHGDLRMGNLMVRGGRVEAVLDWELAHIGDPASDLGWVSAVQWRFGGPGVVAGVGSREALLRGYSAAADGPSPRPRSSGGRPSRSSNGGSCASARRHGRRRSPSAVWSSPSSDGGSRSARRMCSTHSASTCLRLPQRRTDPRVRTDPGVQDGSSGTDGAGASGDDGASDGDGTGASATETMVQGLAASFDRTYEGRMQAAALDTVLRDLRVGPALREASSDALATAGFAARPTSPRRSAPGRSTRTISGCAQRSQRRSSSGSPCTNHRHLSRIAERR